MMTLRLPVSARLQSFALVWIFVAFLCDADSNDCDLLKNEVSVELLQSRMELSPGSVTIGVAGDVLLHQELFVQAMQYGYESLWAPMVPFMQKPDLMYVNLEGPIAPGISIGSPKNIHEAFRSGCHEAQDPGHHFDGFVYTGFPRFNYRPELVKALWNSGVDIVSTANNHAFDRCEIGVKRTIDSLRAAGLLHFGTRQNISEPFHSITKVKNFSIAWLSCVYIERATVEMGPITKSPLIMTCEKDLVANTAKPLSLQHDVDAVIVTPHWGHELSDVFEWQREWAHAWLDAGAVAVLGNHPHVVQNAEDYVTQDGRKTFIIYSIGNFISHQPNERSASVFLEMRLRKTKQQKAVVDDISYLPIVTVRTEVEHVAGGEASRCPAAFGDLIPRAYQVCDRFTVKPLTLGSEEFEQTASFLSSFHDRFARSMANLNGEAAVP